MSEDETRDLIAMVETWRRVLAVLEGQADIARSQGTQEPEGYTALVEAIRTYLPPPGEVAETSALSIPLGLAQAVVADMLILRETTEVVVRADGVRFLVVDRAEGDR